MKLMVRSLASLLLLLPLAIHAQPVFNLTADQLQNGQAVELDKLGWKYSPNDDPRFADPQFDDRAWETLPGTAITLASIPKSGWRGIGWFRLHLRVAPELVGVPLNLEMFHLGASEIYVDGKQIGRFGVVGRTRAEETAYNPNGLPLGVVFQPESEHVVAVRYSNQQAADLNSFWSKWQMAVGAGVSFRSRIKRFGESTNQGPDDVYGFSYGLFQGAFSLALGILHLLLYVFLPRQRANLFYGIFLLGLAWANFLGSLYLSAHYGLSGLYFLNLVAQAYVVVNVSLLAFVYTAFNQLILRRIWLFLTLAFIKVLLHVLYPGQLENWVDALLKIAVSLESLRIMYHAIRQRLAGAWIVGAGLLFYFVAAGRNFIAAIIQVYGSWFIVMDALAFYGLMLIISIHLAREFARTNDNLEDQLVQVNQLSAAALEHEKVKAENERRAKELEEARQLQLSMLPKKLPNLPHLDIAAYMKTASEVGGDYYDFHTGDDGTLTVAIGDATGHGLKAGTMVASVKSLFVSLAYHPDIPHIFTRMSQTLKQMQMRGVFMALALVKYHERRANIAIAGMPSPLLYRGATNTVERINLTGLPLGGVTSYRYREMTMELQPGDVLLLLSDGLTECFNPADEMFGEERVEQCLQACAQGTPDEIIARLLAEAEVWAEGRKLDDDLTLVVLKAK